MDLTRRYDRNFGALTREDSVAISSKRACVIGCGGLGGHIIEMLARLGFGAITAVDGDVFDVTNLNRQLLSLEDNIGEHKVHAAVARARQINSKVPLFPVNTFLNAQNAGYIIDKHDVVFDALDNIDARRILQKACKEKNIPLIHGAVNGWRGQVSVIMPGDDSFDKIFPVGAAPIADEGNPPFAPPSVASTQVAEAIKLLCGKGEILRNKLLVMDLYTCTCDIINF
ncbi:MAG: HesA/MoeB/ThiF family protein [Oscillospiraceae bacterium]|nr:HesA/MoeB/ThiF family protein [Oscillospiraceae bacterium]